MRAHRKSHQAAHVSLGRQSDEATDLGALSDAMAARASDERTPEGAHDVKADVIAVSASAGGSLLTINRSKDDGIYPYMTGILLGADGTKYTIHLLEVGDRTCLGTVDIPPSAVKATTMEVVLNPGHHGHHKGHRHG
jgi:hypothetical protein